MVHRRHNTLPRTLTSDNLLIYCALNDGHIRAGLGLDSNYRPIFALFTKSEDEPLKFSRLNLTVSCRCDRHLRLLLRKPCKANRIAQSPGPVLNRCLTCDPDQSGPMKSVNLMLTAAASQTTFSTIIITSIP